MGDRPFDEKDYSRADDRIPELRQLRCLISLSYSHPDYILHDPVETTAILRPSFECHGDALALCHHPYHLLRPILPGR